MRNDERKQSSIINLSAEDGGVLYSFAIIATLLVSIIFSTVTVAVVKTNPSFITSSAFIILNFILGPIAILIAIGFLRLRKKSPLFLAIDLKTIDTVAILSAVLILIGLTFGLSEVNNLFVSLLQKAGVSISAPTLPEKTVGGVLASVVFVCVIPAVVEETLFRGFILSGLKSTGIVFAVIISGALFSLFHMSPAQTIYQFIVGAIYALIILYGKNLLITIVMHFINNLYIVLNYYYFNIQFSGGVLIAVTIIGLLCFIGGILLLLLKGNEPIDSEDKKDNKVKFIFGALFGIIATSVTWITTLVA